MIFAAIALLYITFSGKSTYEKLTDGAHVFKIFLIPAINEILILQRTFSKNFCTAMKKMQSPFRRHLILVSSLSTAENLQTIFFVIHSNIEKSIIIKRLKKRSLYQSG